MLRNFSFRVISFAFAFFLSSAPAWAWGSPGHMAVASVAWEKLDATHQASTRPRSVSASAPPASREIKPLTTRVFVGMGRSIRHQYP